MGGATPERVRPEGSSIVIENKQRGTEIATPNRYATDFLSSKDYWNQVTKIGKASTKYEGDLVQHAKTMNKVLTSPETNIQRSSVLETQREGLSEATVKGGLTGIGEKQGNLSFFNIKTGKAGKIQGSTSTEQFLPSDILVQQKAIAPAHDIDVIKANPLGILEETQAQGLAKYTNLKIQKEQGIAPSDDIVFRGLPKGKLNKLLANQISLTDTSTSKEVYTTPEASTALFFGEYNNPGKNIGVAKIELTSDSDILRFTDIPKSERPKNSIGDWRKSNPILIDYARSQGKAGLRKPLKTGGEEVILFDNSLVKGVSAVSPSIRFTQVQGRRIFEGKEKAIEFVTRKDETGSSIGKSGSVYGTAIDTATFKSTIKGTNKSVKHTSGIFQAQTNLAKIGIQTKESAKAQSATESQLKIIGEGEIFSPELFAEKAIIRPYYQTLATSRELLKNPETKGLAMKGIESAHAMRYYRFDNPETALFKWETKPNKTVDDFLKEKQTETSTLSPKSKSSNIGSRVYPTGSNIFSRYPNIRQSRSINSSLDFESNYTGSRVSKSTKSSTKSALSSLNLNYSSGLSSSKSPKSSLSSKPSSSIFSPSGSSKSPSSPSSRLPGSSIPKSSLTSLTSLTPSSSRTPSSRTPSYNTTNTFNFKIRKYSLGNIGIKRKGKTRYGPTALINLGVKNPFTSTFSYKVPKGKRFEF